MKMDNKFYMNVETERDTVLLSVFAGLRIVVWNKTNLSFDSACTVQFVELVLCLTNKCTKYLLTLSYVLQLQHVSVPKNHCQEAVPSA